ncbi:MAG: hypothetical protein EPN88_07595 [Bacteroidetes bacterium]|nr:MAG: hypothetical protein EPN88_07595 [Bacteroidota bacterium]
MLKLNFKYYSGYLLKSELLRSASILISGTVIAQLISFFLQPFIRRFFSLELFGTYSAYLSLIGIITVVSSFRFDDTIVLPKTDKESTNVIGLSLIFNFFVNLVLFIFALVNGEKIKEFLNLSSSFPVPLYVVPIGAFLYNSYQCLNFWLIRKRKYYSVSINKLLRRSTEGVSQVIFALLKFPFGLIFSDIIGQIANVFTVIIQTFRNGLNLKLISLNRLKYVFKKYRDFPIYNMIPAFMSTCSFLLPPLFINMIFSAESAGIFDAAKFVLSVPLALVGSSFSSVLLQKVSEKYNKRESFLTDLKPVILIVGAISIAEIFAILFFGEDLLKILFGKTYIFSGRISKILVWSFTFNFTVSTFTTIFVSMRRIKAYSLYQLFYFLAILSLLFFKSLEFTEFLKVYVIIEVICYCLLTSVLIYIIARYEISLKQLIAK